MRVPLDPVGTPFCEHWKKLVVAAVRVIASAAPGCVAFHCAGGKDRTRLLALVLLTLARAAPNSLPCTPA